MIFCSGLELNKVQTAVSKHLGILSKIWGGGNSARIWVKTASSATIIALMVYSVMWCRGSVKNVMVYSMVWHAVQWLCGGPIN